MRPRKVLIARTTPFLFTSVHSLDKPTPQSHSKNQETNMTPTVTLKENGSLTGELAVTLRLITASRECLIKADSPGQLLFARVLWRATELRLITYQLKVGDVVIRAQASSLPVTIRASQQLRAKLAKDTNIKDDNAHRKDSDTQVELSRLSHQLNKILFHSREGTEAEVDSKMMVDWYNKLTFVLGTLTHSSDVIKLTTLGFPHDASRPVHYENIEATQVIASLSMIVIPKEANESKLEQILAKPESFKIVRQPLDTKVREVKEAEEARILPKLSYADVVKGRKC